MRPKSIILLVVEEMRSGSCCRSDLWIARGQAVEKRERAIAERSDAGLLRPTLNESAGVRAARPYLEHAVLVLCLASGRSLQIVICHTIDRR